MSIGLQDYKEHYTHSILDTSQELLNHIRFCNDCTRDDKCIVIEAYIQKLQNEVSSMKMNTILNNKDPPSRVLVGVSYKSNTTTKE